MLDEIPDRNGQAKEADTVCSIQLAPLRGNVAYYPGQRATLNYPSQLKIL
jgi:hypothetical protein